ncbi:MAG: PfkB family carbohydrate kinase [bacterium]
MSASLRSYVDRFPSLRVAVVGDFVADEFIYGDSSRISREAPVLVLNFRSREIIPGGGGNAAMNVASLGGNVIAVSALGSDPNGNTLSRVLSERSISVDHLYQDGDRITPTKMRIMAGGRNTSRQQVIRVDHECQLPMNSNLEKRILAAIEKLAEDGLDALIVSDYGLGVVTDSVRQIARQVAQKMVVTVDSRHAADMFRDVTAITPNEEEVEELVGFVPDEERLDEAGAALLERTRARAALITRGSEGMSLFEQGAARRDIPVYGSDEATDVTGAGDTVISAFSLALAAGASMAEAAEIANRAAGIVVMKHGTAVVSQKELLGAVEDG